MDGTVWGELGPVEGWVVKLYKPPVIGVVKGCEHPLPSLFYVPKLVGSTRVASGPTELCRHVACRETRCVRGLQAPTVLPGSEAVLENPVDALRRLSWRCGRRICRAAAGLAELLSSAHSSIAVGVTGSLAYKPERARDIDLVVYGSTNKAYRALRDLRRDGATEPLPPGSSEEEKWTEGARRLHIVIASRRLLYGRYKGYNYTVRLVACPRPTPCSPAKRLGDAVVEGLLVPLQPHTTPAHYLLETGKRRVYVYTLRLQYTELPVLWARAAGVLEERCGRRILIPDHGYIEPLQPPETLK